jgi:hypothetical protein
VEISTQEIAGKCSQDGGLGKGWKTNRVLREKVVCSAIRRKASVDSVESWH